MKTKAQHAPGSTEGGLRSQRITLIDRHNVASAIWPKSDQAEQARGYIEPMISAGVHHYVENAHVNVMALCIDDQVLPLVESDDVNGDTNLVSLRSHYVDYPRTELRRVRNTVLRMFMKAGLGVLSILIPAFRLGQIIYVNNWILSTNPPIALSPQQVEKITRFLVEKFPGRAIVFRSLNEKSTSTLMEALRGNGYHFLRSRKIYFFDPDEPRFKRNYETRRDIRLLEQSSYENERATTGSDSDFERVTQLYRDLYLEKYTEFNPAFTKEFFRNLVMNRLMIVILLRNNGRIDAFGTWLVAKDLIIGSHIGYDQTVPRKIGLYRQVIAAKFKESLSRQQLLNLSAGADDFKRYRGGIPIVEYYAVYDKHLPVIRRIGWRVLSAIIMLWEQVDRRGMILKGTAK